MLVVEPSNFFRSSSVSTFQNDVNLHGAILARPMAYLTLTFDHRIIDGAIADMFLVTVKEALEVRS